MTDNEALEVLNEMIPWLELIMSRRRAEAIIHAAAVLENKAGWIPTSERLPRPKEHLDDLVIVCRKDGSVALSRYVSGKWIYGEQDVEYWMPLPALPESEDKKCEQLKK